MELRQSRCGSRTLCCSTLAPQADGTIRFEATTEVTVILGLSPHSSYDVEIDDEELAEGVTDAGGALVVGLPPETQAGVRVRRRL
jgi:hypothetical protein